MEGEARGVILTDVPLHWSTRLAGRLVPSVVTDILSLETSLPPHTPLTLHLLFLLFSLSCHTFNQENSWSWFLFIDLSIYMQKAFSLLAFGISMSHGFFPSRSHTSQLSSWPRAFRPLETGAQWIHRLWRPREMETERLLWELTKKDFWGQISKC